MGHRDHVHGRVFRGLKKDTRKMVPFSKRSDEYSENVHNFIHRRQTVGHNTNGDRIVMHVPEDFPEKATDSDKTIGKLSQKAQADEDQPAVETVYEQVFKTLDQTFDGPPQFFSTQSVAHTSTSATQQPAVQTTAAARQQNTNDEDQTPSRQAAAQVIATSPSSSAEPTSTAAQRSTTSAEKQDASTTKAAIEVSSSSIVTGDVAATRGAQLADSTSSMSVGTPLSATHSATPETEQTGMTGGAKAGLAVGIILGLALAFGLIFFCWRRKKNQRELEEYNEKSAFAAAPVPVNRFSSDSNKLQRTSTQTSATAPRLSLRPVTQFLPNLTANGNDQNNAQNPFGDAAVVSEKNGHDRSNSAQSDSSSSVASAGAPATPGSAQLATAAAVPLARGPNNVHRVQLEFKPSMDDELELKSGQLVRMLHEYDDGWALCATMDRSRKGVVPRTCLSKMPVKPRGPPSQNSLTPAGPNSMLPPGANVPRPLTPTTPTQQGRSRAPTLDGVPARKPVPGQAM